MVRPYDEIFSASDRNSFFLFRSARLARTASVSKARTHIAAIPRAETINATHQCSGTDERISGRECITGIFLLKYHGSGDCGDPSNLVSLFARQMCAAIAQDESGSRSR